MKEQNFEKTLLYWPLFSLILVAAWAAWAISYSAKGGIVHWMHYFMGFLFCQFSLLKLFDIHGFADGFQKYDLIAKKNRTYALSYPAIELALGLSYLSMMAPLLTYFITIVLMAIGAAGVTKGLKKGLDIYCPCMGSVLKVPLSSVTLAEDIIMGSMALLMLLIGLLF